MRIVFKHILKNIWEKKWRSLLIILSLVVATTVFILNLTLPSEITLKFQETLRSIYGDAEVVINSVDSFSLDDIKVPDEDFKYFGFSSSHILIEEDPAMLFGVDIKNTKEMKMLGADVPMLKKNEVVISSKQAEKYLYKEGDKIIVSFGDKKYELEIVKIVEKKGLTALEKDYPLFIAGLETVNEINGVENNEYQSLYLDVLDDDKVQMFVEYVKNNNENFEIEELIDTEAIKESLSFVSYIMTLIFALATIMIFFVVSSLNKIIIAERIPVIGTFRSIGATKGKMNFILLLENVVYGVIGGFIGTILGYAINSIAAELFIGFSDVNLSSKTMQIGFGSLLIGVVFAVLLEIFISINTIRKANKKPIKDIIFDIQSTRYKIRRKRTVLGILMIFLSLFLCYFNTKTNLALTILAIILLVVGVANIVPFIMRVMSKLLVGFSKNIGWATGIIASKNIGYNKMIISSARLIVISVSLIISILTISSSVTELFGAFRHIFADYNIVVQNIRYSYDKYDKLLDVDNVEDISYMFNYYDGNLTYNDGKKFDFTPSVLGQDESRLYIKELDYKIEDLKYNELLIDEKLAEKNNIKVNDTLKLRFDILNKEIEFRVAGFINTTYFTTSRNVLLINLNNYLENLTSVPTQIHILANDDADIEKVKKDIKDIINEVNIRVQTVDEYLGEQEKETDKVMSLFYIIIGLSVALSFIGIVNNQIISFIQRRKELAVLNSTCMSKKQLKKMLMVETIFTNLIACFIAIVLSLIITGMLELFMQGLSLYVDVIFDWKLTFIFVGIIFVVLLLTLVLPAKRLNKMNVVTEIKYE